VTDFNQRWTYGGAYAFRILAEFSLTEMKVEVFDGSGQHAIAAKNLIDLPEFQISDKTWEKVWQRMESDGRGPYVAVALRL
jgi:hypothetical protein